MLVDNLEEAMRGWRNNGSGQSFVTPDGDMVDERGIVSGGKLARTSGGLLARKREIRELKEKVTAGQMKVDDSKSRLERVYLEIEEKRQVVENLNNEKWTCQEEIGDVQEAYRLLKDSLTEKTISQAVWAGIVEGSVGTLSQNRARARTGSQEKEGTKSGNQRNSISFDESILGMAP